jgi:hypothetical protein
MRRIFAITAVATLICTMVLPLWAMPCCKKGGTAVCHRTAAHQHHCDEMADQNEQSATPASDDETAVRGLPDKCPMNCCMQMQSGNETAIPAFSFSPQLAVSEYNRDFSAIVFARTGFSSHTDRGPPLS